MIIPLYQVGKDAYGAGWRGIHLAEAIATSYGEASAIGDTVDTLATNLNPDGSTDRGMWALNNHAHPEITDAQAFDQTISSGLAHALYLDQGWRPWVAFGGARYQQAYPKALIIAQQLMSLPGWLPLSGFAREWSAPLGHWVYRRRVNGVLVEERTVPVPDPVTGFTVWDATLGQYTFSAPVLS